MFSLFFFLLLLKTRKNGRIAGFPSVVYTIWKVGLSLMVADKKKERRRIFLVSSSSLDLSGVA